MFIPIFFAATLILIVTLNLKTLRDARQAIAAWASDQDATVQNVKMPLFGGPFWYKRGVTYIVTLGFERGGPRKAWVFWPTWSGMGESMLAQWIDE